MTLRSTVVVRVAALLTESRDLDSPQTTVNLYRRIRLPDGTGPGYADRIATVVHTLAPGQSEDLDLRGALPDGLGGMVTFTRLRGLVVIGAPDNQGAINVKTDNITGGTGAKTGDGVPVHPGGFFAWTSPQLGAAVVPTEDEITFVNVSGAPAGYEAIIIGCSA